MPNTFKALLFFTTLLSLAFAQSANPSVTVDGYKVLFTQPVDGTSLVVAQVNVTNHGAAISGVHGVVTSASPDLVIEAGEVSFGAIAQDATAASQNTFTFRQNNTAPLNLSNLNVRFDSPTRRSAIRIRRIEPSGRAGQARHANRHRQHQSLRKTAELPVVSGVQTRRQPGRTRESLQRNGGFHAGRCRSVRRATGRFLLP
jgi:hypothetical protein